MLGRFQPKKTKYKLTIIISEKGILSTVFYFGCVIQLMEHLSFVAIVLKCTANLKHNSDLCALHVFLSDESFLTIVLICNY